MTTYLRKTKSYTKVSTRVTESKMSIGAIGLLTLIFSNQDSYVIYKGVIQKRAKVGKLLFTRFWNELETNGFVKEIITNKGRINYEYIIVNDPTNEESIGAIKQLTENRNPFSIDDELNTENNIQNIVDVKKGANISLNNKNISNVDISNVDVNNEDIDNVSLGINKNSNDIDELIEYWYNNINNIQLEECELQIFEDTLFISTYNQLISTLKDDPTILNSINYRISLYDLFKLFNDVKNNHLRQELPFTSYYLANELFEILQLD